MHLSDNADLRKHLFTELILFSAFSSRVIFKYMQLTVLHRPTALFKAHINYLSLSKLLVYKVLYTIFLKLSRVNIYFIKYAGNFTVSCVQTPL